MSCGCAARCLGPDCRCPCHGARAEIALAQLTALADAGWDVAVKRRDTISGARAYVVSATLPPRLAEEVTSYHGAPNVTLAVGDAWGHARRVDSTLPSHPALR